MEVASIRSDPKQVSVEWFNLLSSLEAYHKGFISKHNTKWDSIVTED
jgi:hypothetical protein